jgi:putative hydrolase of the HAD superfamily
MPLVSNYNGFIFDYGGVLVSHQTEEEQERMGRVAGMDRELFDELYWSRRAEYDRDALTAPEYWLDIAARAGKTLSEHAIEELIELDNQSWMHFDEVMWEWIAQLRAAGKRVAVLSNMPRELGEILKATTDRFQLFDQVTLSYEVRSIKPEPAIYEHCLEGLGLEPKETLFLDDRIANVQGAEMLGIDSIEFLDRDDVLLRVRA